MQNVSLFVFIFLLFVVQNGSSQSTPQPVTSNSAPATGVVKKATLSFLEWKAERVAEAQQKLEQIAKSQSSGAASSSQVWQEGRPSSSDGKVSSLEADETLHKINEQKLTFNVDVALQLNIHDYFSMYLKSLSLDEFNEATKRLTINEAGELLLAYKNSLEKEKKIPLKLSKIPKDNAKSKNQ